MDKRKHWTWWQYQKTKSQVNKKVQKDMIVCTKLVAPEGKSLEVFKIHPLEITNVCTKMCANPLCRWRDIFLNKWKTWPVGGTRWEVWITNFGRIYPLGTMDVWTTFPGKYLFTNFTEISSIMVVLKKIQRVTKVSRIHPQTINVCTKFHGNSQ